MAENELVEALRALAKERDIDEIYMLNRLEQALAPAYAKILRLDWDAKVIIDREQGSIYVYEMVPDEDSYDEELGDYTVFEEVDVTPDDASRIAAMHAKTVITNIVREAGRMQIYRDYVSRKGDLISGTVLQSTADFTILRLSDGIECELPHFTDLKRFPNERNEKPANERYQHNQRLYSIIIDVRDPRTIEQNSRGEISRPPIVVSRTHPDLIRRLFENEVPEIYDRQVEIKAVAREAGARSKVAVWSNERNLDPVGACVGPKGSRVRAVVSELRGEKVDVIEWSEDPAVFVAKALSPAQVNKVTIDPQTGNATVIVPDDQLSLAIGKEGQNARLAAHLTGRRIDIKAASLLMRSQSNESFFDNDVEEEDIAFCEHVTSDGTRCRNHARPGSRYCGLHASEEA